MLYWNVERRFFPDKIWALNMHSHASLVVCRNIKFLLPKYEEKKTWKNFVFLLSKITFEPDTPGT